MGEVVNISGTTVIVQGNKIGPRAVGKIVIDKKMNEVGRVVDVFGPVDAPYAKIVLFSKETPFRDSAVYLR
ncbi:H/ACA RNA-protein complex component Gar1 [archaeon]|nr:MAG: H/ACA RNA-protein complex component Gar1 [archaeon]